MSRLLFVTADGRHLTTTDLGRDAAGRCKGDHDDAADAEQLYGFLEDRSADTWIAACAAYAALVEASWLDAGLFHEADGTTPCSAAERDELRADLDATRAWPMPTQTDTAVAAE